MRKFKKLSAVLLSVVLLLSCMTITAYAAERETQDGLSAVIETDKESYEANEPILVTVTVTNNNSFAMKNVSIESILPASLTISDGTLKSDTVNLEAGQELTLTFTAVLEKDVPPVTEPGTSEPDTSEPGTSEPDTTDPTVTDPSEPPTSEPDTTEPGTSEPDTTEPVVTEPSTSEPDTTEPAVTNPTTQPTSETPTAAGEVTTTEEQTTLIPEITTAVNAADHVNGTSPITGAPAVVLKVLLVVVMVAAVAFAVVMLTRKNGKKATKIISVVLSAVIGVSALATTGMIAKAEENTRSFSVDKTITVDREDYNIEANILYTSEENNDYQDLIEGVDIDSDYEYTDDNISFDEENGLEYINNIIIMMFDTDCTDSERAEAINSVNGKVVGGRISTDTLYIQVETSTLNQLLNICEELNQNYKVDAFVDQVFSSESVFENLSYVPNDTYILDSVDKDAETFNNTLALEWSGYDNPPYGYRNWHHLAINSTEAWKYNEYLNNISIGIADSGFSTSHDDLEIQIVSETNDGTNHGTHVAGIIGATPNNSQGATGIVWNKTLYGYDLGTVDQFTWTRSSFFKALETLVENGCKTINYSQGFSGYLPNSGREYIKLTLYMWGREASKEIEKLLEKGYDFVVVQSAGNGAKDQIGVDTVQNGLFASITEENCYSNKNISKYDVMNRVITVTNAQISDDSYQLTSSSNGGNADIAAPGAQIYSTIAGVEERNDDGTIRVNSGQKYDIMSGTSMAAPMVTGVAGLVWSVNPNFSGAEVRDIVCTSVDKNIVVHDNPASPTTGNFNLVNAQLAVEEAIRRTYDTCTIIGNIVDTQGNPLPDVEIAVKDVETGKTITGMTDENGQYSFFAPVGKYYFTYTKEGYGDMATETLEASTKGQVLNLGELIMFPFEFAGGDGTIENPYQVSTPAQLNAVRNDLDAHYIQINDIDMSDWGNWESIGNISTPFNGSYNGGNYSIANLSISVEAQDTVQPSEDITSVGLFGYAPDSVLKNIHLTSCNTKVDFVSNYFGSIVGYGGEIYNCSSVGNLVANSYCAGGIAGLAKKIANCSFDGMAEFYSFSNSNSQKPLYTISKVSGYFGGICGICDDVQTSHNSATIKAQGKYETFLGGVAGYGKNVEKSYNIGDLSLYTTGRESDWPEAYLGGVTGISRTVSNCYNSGNLLVDSYDYSGMVGGITGCGHTSYQYCYNTGNLTNSSAFRYSGSIIGLAYTTTRPKISYCYGNISQLAGTGNIRPDYSISNSAYLDAEKLKNKASYVGFDFDNIWGIDEKTNNGYPYLLN